MMLGQDMTAALVDRIAQAHARRNPLRICGGSSKEFLRCRYDGEPLEIGMHKGIIDYEPNELVMTVRAGTRLDEIDAALSENRQMVGFEPPRFSPAATIGGTLACNLSGPARPWLGSIRDAVLGIRLINGRGELLRFGGRVIKNVAGFDASRLQAGAFGALGVITELSFKVLPCPQSSVTVSHELDARTSLQRMNELAGTCVPVSAAAWCAGRQFIRLSGSAAAVASARGDIGGDTVDDAFWQQLRDHDTAIFGAAENRPLWRLSVKSTAATLLDDDVIVDWGGALRFLHSDASLEEMSAIARDAGGYAMRLGQNTGSHEFLQQPSAAVRALHERLKQAFDPARILNPGRLYGWL